MDRFLKAFGHPTRLQIFTYLQSRPTLQLTVDEVAAAQGVHRTVAFDHLELLAELKFLIRGGRSGLRGRPARTYRVAGTAEEVSNPPRRHRLLASLLAGALVHRNNPGIAEAKQAGKAYGREMAAGSSTDTLALAKLRALSARYELKHDRIKARNCIFREACGSAPKVVCGLQAGILEGALGVAGPHRTVVPNGPNESGGCSYSIEAGSPPSKLKSRGD